MELDIVTKLRNQKDTVVFDENKLPTPELSAEELVSKMEGDTDEAGVNVDLSEDGEKVKVTLDQDVKDAISGNNTVEITITDDDWNEEEGMYVKHININNSFINIVFENITHTDSYLALYCPYIKYLIQGKTSSYIDGISGIDYSPEIRNISTSDASNGTIGIFNGIVYSGSKDI